MGKKLLNGVFEHGPYGYGNLWVMLGGEQYLNTLHGDSRIYIYSTSAKLVESCAVLCCCGRHMQHPVMTSGIINTLLLVRGLERY